MRITDKKSKFSVPSNISTVHECAESGDLNGLHSLLGINPSMINARRLNTVDTPLHVSSSHNKVEVVKYLLEWRGPQNVDLEAKNVNGETPLHVAVKNGCKEAARLLISHGADAQARTYTLLTPVHMYVGYAVLSGGDQSMLQVFTDYNVDCSDAMRPFNHIPEGLDDKELKRVVSQIIGQNTINTGNISTGSQTFEGTKDYDNGIQGKIDKFNDELSKIVGLRDLKSQLQKWAKGMLLDEKRREMGINLGPRKSPHMAFLGNPGTGKTTVARILGKLLQSVGVLTSDKVIEVQRTDLIAEYLGQTGAKTRKKIEEAEGGILFVDEAYRLVPEDKQGNIDYGKEALEEIMSVLEDGNLVLIFAGYTEPMKRVFSSNQGFCRRVTHFFEFEDFTSNDLAEMLMIKMTKQNEGSRLYGFKLHPLCTFDVVRRLIERNSTEKLRNKMNGGLVDHLLNNARENLDSRLTMESKGEELLTITVQDLEAGLKVLAKRVVVD